MTPTATYPRRPAFFAHRFTRLLFKACVANDVGTDALTLLIAIAHQEDAKKYSGAVSYWNGQLMPLIGCNSETTFKRIRGKCVDAGWLHYTPGSKSRAANYWVVIPKTHTHWNDSPTDEKPSEYAADSGPKLTGNVAYSRPDLTGNADGMRTECGRNPDGIRPPSIPTPVPIGTDASRLASAPTPKPRKEPTGPHAEAVAGWCSRWETAYGVKAVFNGGKDGTAVKWMLGQVADVAGLFAVFDRYLADRSDFVTEARHTLGVLRGQFTRWMVDALPAKAREPTANGKPQFKTKAQERSDYFASQGAFAFSTDPNTNGDDQ